MGVQTSVTKGGLCRSWVVGDSHSVVESKEPTEFSRVLVRRRRVVGQARLLVSESTLFPTFLHGVTSELPCVSLSGTRPLRQPTPDHMVSIFVGS